METSIDKNHSVYVAGHQGMVGTAVERKLRAEGFERILTRTRSQLDLTDSQAVQEFIAKEKPDCIIVCAARVGGIHANSTYPAEFLYDNTMIAANLVHAAYLCQVPRLLYLGSSCIYPREAPQPIKEDYLLSGFLEKTNEAYAIAKIAGLKLCETYRKQYGCLFYSAMPCNLYGTGDNYHPENSHVLPALLRRFHGAKQANASEVVLWGTGKPRREFMHVDDLADGLFHLIQLPDPPSLVNVGYGEDVTIREAAETIADVVGYKGRLVNDTSKPDGTMRKLMDSSLMRNLGWQPKISLKEGLARTYEDFLKLDTIRES